MGRQSSVQSFGAFYWSFCLRSAPWGVVLAAGSHIKQFPFTEGKLNYLKLAGGRSYSGIRPTTWSILPQLSSNRFTAESNNLNPSCGCIFIEIYGCWYLCVGGTQLEFENHCKYFNKASSNASRRRARCSHCCQPVSLNYTVDPVRPQAVPSSAPFSPTITMHCHIQWSSQSAVPAHAAPPSKIE